MIYVRAIVLIIVTSTVAVATSAQEAAAPQLTARVPFVVQQDEAARLMDAPDSHAFFDRQQLIALSVHSGYAWLTPSRPAASSRTAVSKIGFRLNPAVVWRRGKPGPSDSRWEWDGCCTSAASIGWSELCPGSARGRLLQD
ncbi:MAG: hypothetical protein ACLP3R_01910 [Candidatus Korobacteraceae bacterium]